MNKQENNIENLLPLYIDGKTNQAESAMVEAGWQKMKATVKYMKRKWLCFVTQILSMS